MASQDIQFDILGKQNCALCAKSKAILDRLALPYEFRDVETDVDAKADFAFYDGDSDALPMILAWNAAGVVVRRWTGRDVGAGLYKAIVEAQLDGWRVAKVPEKKNLTRD